MRLIFSKAARVEGTILSKRGDKYIRAGKRTGAIIGVYTAGGTRRTFTDLGWQSTYLPEGIVTYGPMLVQMRKLCD